MNTSNRWLKLPQWLRFSLSIPIHPPGSGDMTNCARCLPHWDVTGWDDYQHLATYSYNKDCVQTHGTGVPAGGLRVVPGLAPTLAYASQQPWPPTWPTRRARVARALAQRWREGQSRLVKHQTSPLQQNPLTLWTETDEVGLNWDGPCAKV